MILRRVERIEAMNLVLDLGTLCHREAQLAEGPHDGVRDLSQGMESPQGTTASGKSKIGGFFRQCRLEFQNTAHLGQHGLQLLLGGVDCLAR